MAYDNITYGYPHYIVVYSVESDGIWVYEANYGGRCKINKRKITYLEIYNQFDGIYHRTPNNYKLSDVWLLALTDKSSEINSYNKDYIDKNWQQSEYCTIMKTIKLSRI